MWNDLIRETFSHILPTGALSGFLSSPHQEVDNFVLTVVRKDGIQGSKYYAVKTFAREMFQSVEFIYPKIVVFWRDIQPSETFRYYREKKSVAAHIDRPTWRLWSHKFRQA